MVWILQRRSQQEADGGSVVDRRPAGERPGGCGCCRECVPQLVATEILPAAAADGFSSSYGFRLLVESRGSNINQLNLGGPWPAVCIYRGSPPCYSEAASTGTAGAS